MFFSLMFYLWKSYATDNGRPPSPPDRSVSSKQDEQDEPRLHENKIARNLTRGFRSELSLGNESSTNSNNSFKGNDEFVEEVRDFPQTSSSTSTDGILSSEIDQDNKPIFNIWDYTTNRPVELNEGSKGRDTLSQGNASSLIPNYVRNSITAATKENNFGRSHGGFSKSSRARLDSITNLEKHGKGKKLQKRSKRRWGGFQKLLYNSLHTNIRVQIWDSNTKKLVDFKKLANSLEKPMDEVSISELKYHKKELEELVATMKDDCLTPMKRGVFGLAPLPWRLNNYERVVQDSELLRVFSGKNKLIYEFIPFREKPTGIAAGTIYQKKHTCSNNKGKKKMKLWLGKIGWANLKDMFGEKFLEKYGDFGDDIGFNMSVISEYIANCMYRVLSDGSFETPKNRLSQQPIFDKFTKDNYELKNFIMPQSKVDDKSLRIMSKWCDEYQDLGKLRVKKENGEMVGFTDFVQQTKSVPVKAIEPISGKEVKVDGLLGLLATSTSLGDHDSLGGQCGNAGFIVIRNRNHEVVSIRIVKVDPGFSFLYKRVRDNYLSQLEIDLLFFHPESEKAKKIRQRVNAVKSDPRDIRFSPTLPPIEWNNLTKEQKYEFLEVKIHHFEIINDRRILEYIFFRKGLFNKDKSIRMTKNVADDLIKDLRSHIISEMTLYSDDLLEYRKIRVDILVGKVEYYEKIGDYDRAVCTTEKLLEFRQRDKDIYQITKMFERMSYLELQRGQLKRAFSFFERQLELCLRRKSENSLMKKCYSNISGLFYKFGKINRAIHYSLRVLEINKRTLGENNRAVAYGYNNLGNMFSEKREYNKSFEFYKKALTIQLRVLPKDHPDIAKSYNNLESIHTKRGEIEKAEKMHKKALAIRVKMLPENHPDNAVSYHELGNVFSKKREYDKSIKNHKKALSIQRKSLPENHPDIATSYGNLGTAYAKKCEYEKSIEHFKKGLDVQLRSLPENHPIIAGSYFNLGLAYGEKGEYSKSFEIHKKALLIRQVSLPENHPDIADSYHQIGCMHVKFGEFDESVENFKRALSIQLISLPQNHPSVGKTYYNLGVMYSKTKKYKKSIECLKKSLSIYEKSLPSENHPHMAPIYIQMGLIYLVTGEFEKSMENIKKALSIQVKSLPENHPEIARSYKTIGLVFLKSFKYEEAIDYLKMSLSILKKSLTENHPEIGEIFENLGIVYSNENNFGKAAENFMLAFEIYSISFGRDHKITIRALNKYRECKKQRNLITQFGFGDDVSKEPIY